MIRLTGLPAVEGVRRARVAREPGRLILRFEFADDARPVQRFDLPTATLGEDPEAAELRLLARLAELGFRAERDEPRDS